MKKNTKIVLLIAVIIILSLSIFWIFSWVPNKTEPNRIANIPKSAAWSGGSDGGFWFDFVRTQIDSNKVRLRIYNEYDGALILDADFTPLTNCKIPEGKAILDSINYFDYKKIVLRNGCELTPIYPTYAGSF